MKLSIEPCLWEELGQISKYLNQLFGNSLQGIEHIWNNVFHVELTVLSIFQKTVTFDHNLTPFT